MAIVFGARPGGKNSFALVALYLSQRLPASVIVARSVSSVDEIRNLMVGTAGEWNGLAAVAIDAPLSWSGTLNGTRACDATLKARLPAWAPKNWQRQPNSHPGAIGIQGPALAWALADEIKHEQLPQHQMMETNAKLCLALTCADRKADVQKYAGRGLPKPARQKHAQRLIEHFVESGVIRLETEVQPTAEILEALVASLAALSVAEPKLGLVSHTFEGGEIRPAGKRPVVLLEALP